LVIKTKEANKMNYVERWMKKEEMRDKKQQKYIEKKNLKQEAQKQEIFSILSKYGIEKEDVHTNGYWFQFEYNDLHVNFVNQTERLCGEMYRSPVNSDEQRCVRDARMIMHEGRSEFKEFQREFDYRSFVVYGSTKSATKDVMKIAKMPLEKVVRNEGRDGTIVINNSWL
tara:strand:+ start:380 stop:889 length:510 start_codon:yes stop_codon:yes gene_type:complete